MIISGVGSCPDGFVMIGGVTDKCYEFNPNKVTWTQAVSNCQSRNAKLVEPMTAAENDDLKDQFSNHKYSALRLIQPVTLACPEFL